MFALRLQHYYQTDKQYKQTGINTASLRAALKHFHIHFSEEKVIAIFQGGEGKRGRKSAKQLRNGYLHRLSDADKDEIANKGPELINEMTKLLKLRINIC